MVQFECYTIKMLLLKGLKSFNIQTHKLGKYDIFKFILANYGVFPTKNKVNYFSFCSHSFPLKNLFKFVKAQISHECVF